MIVAMINQMTVSLIFMRFLTCLVALCLFAPSAHALGFFKDKKDEAQEAQSLLAPHKALYDIRLVAKRSGSRISNISGKMFYEWKPTCDAWVTDHRFKMFYEYADSPGMKISSDFATYETFDGKGFDFSVRRNRNKNLYQKLRGQAVIADKGGSAEYTIPEDLSFELQEGTLFPMGHTLEMIKQAKAKKKFFQAVVFDGSDNEGPVEINTFIGKSVNAMKIITPSDDLDMGLLNTPAWNVRLAIFPTLKDNEQSDYEMNLVFHENGIISDMLIEYDDFSVTQKLIALERLDSEPCDSR